MTEADGSRRLPTPEEDKLMIGVSTMKQARDALSPMCFTGALPHSQARSNPGLKR